MKTKEARDLLKGLIVDLDGALATMDEDRHSTAVSAIIVAARLFGGTAINVARIAFALERIADTMEEPDE